MATITMDTSEYEALQKNIKLLEESKERESELHKEIQRLKDEALQELLDNSKKVSIVKESRKVESVYIKKDINDIFKYMDRLFSRYSPNNWLNLSDQEKIDTCIKAFFDFKTNISTLDQTVTTKGFDEVREEFERVYKENLDKDIQTKLNTIPKLEEKIKEIQSKNFDIEIFKADLEKYKSDAKYFKDTYTDATKEFSLYKSNLRAILSKTWNIFNYGDIKREIKNLGLY